MPIYMDRHDVSETVTAENVADPVKAKNIVLNIINDPAFRTIMVISVKRLSLKQNDTPQLKSALHNYINDVLKLLNVYEGKPVNQSEIHFLVSFKSVSNAVHAAFDIQSLFKEFRNDRNNNKIQLKVGLSAGVPVTEKKLIFEEAVKLAERMCMIIKGEIIVSSEVKELYNSESSKSLREGEGIFSLTQTDEKFLTLLMDYTKSNWNNTNLKVDDFSKPMGCSKSQLYRKMILLTGKSPNAFIKEYRLNEALTLLNKKAGNVSEIAFETGFSSPSYFSKCFQKRYGRLPSDYLPAKAG